MGGRLKFYLGVHHPHWLAQSDIPLFVSRRRLAPYRRLPRARAGWILDSGGFTELSMHGVWQTSPAQYVADVRRFQEEIGNMEYAAIQDYMCEPFVLQKTGLTLQEHQRRTVQSYLDLRDSAPDLPWLPVLQGWHENDYVRCVDLYASTGVDLTHAPLVGVGTVCRRQGTSEAAWILRRLHELGLRLHGFGFKITGLVAASAVLTSADSMAWSYDARRGEPLKGCTHRNCANCWRYARAWHGRVTALVDANRYRPFQQRMVGVA